MRVAPDFDRITFAYDFLKTLIFGNSIDNAQEVLIPYIPRDARILIIGGGTGKILEQIMLQKSVESVTYVELSEEMIKKAMERLTPEQLLKIHFFNGPIERLAPLTGYDVVITPFILDMYENSEAYELMEKLDLLLSAKGIWLWTDFQISATESWHRNWQKLLTKTMYWFFSLTTHITAEHLPEVEPKFQEMGYQCLFEAAFYKDFIHSKVYQKKGLVLR